MNARLGAIARPALYTFCLAAPLQVYSLLPFVFVPVFGLAAALLAVLCLASLPRAGKLHVPFEFNWPLAALLAAGVWGWMAGYAGLAVCAAIPFVYWPVYHFARARDTVYRCLWLAALSGGAAGAISVAAQAGLLFPTAFSPATGARWAFAWSVPQGVVLLAACAGAGLAVALTPGNRAMRASALGAAVLCFAALAGAAIEALPQAGQWHGPSVPDTWPARLAAGLALWLVARTLAKLVLSHIEDAPGLQLPLAMLVAVCTLVWLAFPGQPPFALAGLLALAGSYAQPSEVPYRSSPIPRLLAPLLAVLVAINLTVVFPQNPLDTRNYARAARQMIHSGRPAAAAARLLFITTLRPGEQRAYFWLAQTRLAAGDPEGAATAFADMLRAGGGQILPPPTDEEADTFLAQLRDYCAMLPQGRRGLAYERALLVRGETENALTVLRSRARAATQPVSGIAAAPLARGLAGILGNHRLASELSKWPAGELLGLYTSFGALLSTAPPGFPLPGELPLVLTARTGPRTLVITGHSRRHSFGGQQRRGAPGAGVQRSGRWAELFMAGWSPIEHTSEGWAATFLDLARVLLKHTPAVRFRSDTDFLPPAGWRAVCVYLP